MNWTISRNDHRREWVERTVLAAGLVVAGLSIQVSSLVDAHHRQLSVELPAWGVWGAVIAFGAVVPRFIRWWRGRSSSPEEASVPGRTEQTAIRVQPEQAAIRVQPEQAAIPDHDDASAGEATDTESHLRHLLVRQPGAIQIVDVASIRWLEADGRYVRIHTNTGRHLAQYTLADLRERLDPAEFVQIHRSTIVNVRCVRALRTSDYRDFDVALDDGSTLRLSRTFRANLEAVLGSRL